MLVVRLDRRLRLSAGCWALLTALVTAWIGLRLGGGEVTLWVDDVATPVAAGVAWVLCIAARGRHSGRMRLFWTLLACAMACWTFAEIVWGVYALILTQPVPSPSWADVGYLSAIPFTVAALVAHPGTRGDRSRKARSLFEGLIVAMALTFLSWTLVLGPLWHATDLSTAGGLVTVAYPFGDIVIVFFVVLAIRGMSGTDRVALWCLLGALVAMAASDSAYTYLVETGAYSSNGSHLIDAGWIAAYLGIALAAVNSTTHTSARDGTPVTPSLLSLVLPIVPILLALGVAAIQIRLGHHLDRAGWLMAFALVALVLVRQALLLVEIFGVPARHATRRVIVAGDSPRR